MQFEIYLEQFHEKPIPSVDDPLLGTPYSHLMENVDIIPVNKHFGKCMDFLTSLQNEIETNQRRIRKSL